MGKLNYIGGKRCLVRFVIRTLETVAVSGGLGNRESGRGGGGGLRMLLKLFGTFWQFFIIGAHPRLNLLYVFGGWETLWDDVSVYKSLPDGFVASLVLPRYRRLAV